MAETLVVTSERPETRASELSAQAPPPLCVDLDGTLIATDTFFESLILLVKQHPWRLLCLPLWALKGKAYLKRQLAMHVTLDITNLPYRRDLLDYLQAEAQKGRSLVLATGADSTVATAIARHVNLFTAVIASDGTANLSGEKKRTELVTRFGRQGFDYVGNAFIDLKVWPAARAAVLVAPSRSLIRLAKTCAPITHLFGTPTNYIIEVVQALRIHQWVKNFLLFLPLMTAHVMTDVSRLVDATFAFLAFSLCASSLYVVNDLLDLGADRRHPKKRYRPFACGKLPISTGLLLFPMLLASGFLIAGTTLPPHFSLLLLGYAMTTTAYTFFLKKVAVLDVLTLAGLYTLRVFAGGVAVGIPISAWLLAFSLFIFLSLAFGKRHGELQLRKISKHQGIERRAYLGGDKEMLGTMGVTSGYMSILILALYLNSQEVLTSYRQPHILWLLCPMLLYWVSRTWLLAHRGQLDDDPIVITFRDPRNYALAIAISVCVLWAM